MIFRIKLIMFLFVVPGFAVAEITARWVKNITQVNPAMKIRSTLSFLGVSDGVLPLQSLHIENTEDGDCIYLFFKYVVNSMSDKKI